MRTLAIDIGGPVASGTFQNAANSGCYDLVTVSGQATLGGTLSINLISGTDGAIFAPTPTQTFQILTSNSLLNTPAAFSNAFQVSGSTRIFATDGYTVFVASSGSSKNLVLSSGTWNSWKGASGATWDTAGSWTILSPTSNSYVATFADATAASGTVSVNPNGPRTVRGLIFGSSARTYAIGGTNALTLDNTPNAAPATVMVTSGSHSISAPIALASDLTFSGSAGSTLSVTGVISGTRGVTVNTRGLVLLSGSDTYQGATTVNSGTLVLRVPQSTGTIIATGGISELPGSGTVGAIAISGSGKVAVLAHSGSTRSVLDLGSLTFSENALTNASYQELLESLSANDAIAGGDSVSSEPEFLLSPEPVPEPGSGLLLLTGALTLLARRGKRV